LENAPNAKLKVMFPSIKDQQNISVLLQTLVDRAAYLIALEIAAVSVKALGSNGSVFATVEGTVFYKMPGIRQKVIEMLNNRLLKQYYIQIHIAQKESAVLIGTGAIALTF